MREMTLDDFKRRQKIGTKKRAGKYEWLRSDYLSMCPYCGCDISKEFSIDHIEPVTNGGTDEPDNLAPCCRSCNSKKNNMPLILFLRRQRLTNAERYLERF